MKTSSAEDLLSFERRTMNGDRMHYGSQVDKPRYLFGETATLHSGLGKNNFSGSRHYLSDDKHAAASSTQDLDNEIFLNKSGWVQVKQREPAKDVGRSSRFENSNHASKLEDLMLRNEARRNVAMQSFYQKGYLPATRYAFGNLESPPPMTPIISPPPAFQDAAAAAAAAAGGGSLMKNPLTATNQTVRIGKQQLGSRVHLTVSDSDYHHHPHRSSINNGNTSNNGNTTNINSNKDIGGQNGNNGNNSASNNNNNAGASTAKGMVFSRSFEYDNRKMNTDYSDVFSKSFDYDLSTPQSQAAVPVPMAAPSSKLHPSASLLQIQRERMPAFSNLTGNSPNYLTKKEWGPYRQSVLAQPNSTGNSPSTAPCPLGSSGVLTNRSRDTSPNQAKMSKPQMYSASQSPAARKAYGGTARVGSENLKSFEEQVGRSRRAQFSRLRNESSNSSSSRSVDVATVNRRLNSCDSGARSGKRDRTPNEHLLSWF